MLINQCEAIVTTVTADHSECSNAVVCELTMCSSQLQPCTVWFILDMNSVSLFLIRCHPLGSSNLW